MRNEEWGMRNEELRCKSLRDLFGINPKDFHIHFPFSILHFPIKKESL